MLYRLWKDLLNYTILCKTHAMVSAIIPAPECGGVSVNVTA